MLIEKFYPPWNEQQKPPNKMASQEVPLHPPPAFIPHDFQSIMIMVSDDPQIFGHQFGEAVMSDVFFGTKKITREL